MREREHTWIMDDREGIQNKIEKRQVGDRTQWYPRHKSSKIERKKRKMPCDKDYKRKSWRGGERLGDTAGKLRKKRVSNRAGGRVAKWERKTGKRKRELE